MYESRGGVLDLEITQEVSIFGWPPQCTRRRSSKLHPFIFCYAYIVCCLLKGCFASTAHKESLRVGVINQSYCSYILSRSQFQEFDLCSMVFTHTVHHYRCPMPYHYAPRLLPRHFDANTTRSASGCGRLSINKVITIRYLKWTHWGP